MKRDNSRLRQLIRQTEQARAAPVEAILAQRGALRRGAFVSVQRKCGKPNCRCATGEGHPAHYLSVKEGGRTRMVYVPGHLEVRVAEEAERYRRFRQARATLAKLARQCLELVDELELGLQTTEELTTKKKPPAHPSRRRPPRKKR